MRACMWVSVSRPPPYKLPLHTPVAAALPTRTPQYTYHQRAYSTSYPCRKAGDGSDLLHITLEQALLQQVLEDLDHMG